jgi:hypothetical protein
MNPKNLNILVKDEQLKLKAGGNQEPVILPLPGTYMVKDSSVT